MEQFPQYDFEIIFSDNCSEDGTQDILRRICGDDKRIKAILNAKNFPSGSAIHALFQASGELIIFIPADFQVPLELIPEMITRWEDGAKVVALVKTSAKNDKLRIFRRLYYSLSKRLSNQEVLPGFIGNGAYDKSFIDICKMRGNDPIINLIYMTMQYASPLIKLEYCEQPRRSGKSNNNAGMLINIAIRRFISVSDVAPRYAILTGLSIGLGSFIISLYYLIRKLIDWYNFPVGIAPLIIGVFFLGSIQLIFLGLLGEYVLTIEKRQRNEPRVVEKERINFDVNEK